MACQYELYVSIKNNAAETHFPPLGICRNRSVFRALGGGSDGTALITFKFDNRNSQDQPCQKSLGDF